MTISAVRAGPPSRRGRARAPRARVSGRRRSARPDGEGRQAPREIPIGLAPHAACFRLFRRCANPVSQAKVNSGRGRFQAARQDIEASLRRRPAASMAKRRAKRPWRVHFGALADCPEADGFPRPLRHQRQSFPPLKRRGWNICTAATFGMWPSSRNGATCWALRGGFSRAPRTRPGMFLNPFGVLAVEGGVFRFLCHECAIRMP